MRKNISVTNPDVIKIFENCTNVSKLIEESVLHYTGEGAPTPTAGIDEEALKRVIYETMADKLEPLVQTTTQTQLIMQGLVDILVSLSRQEHLFEKKE